MRKHTIDEALEIIQLMHDVSLNKPLLVSVFGAGQDAGKTYFCSYAREKFHQGYCHDVAVSKENPDSYVKDHYDTLEYLFLEVGINTLSPDGLDIKLWNNNIRGFTQRSADLNVFIYNPMLHRPNLETVETFFDIIIENKGSYPKNPERNL